MSSQAEGWAEGLVGGELAGRYRLERILGMGGMGAVFAATHLAVGREVAIKVLLPDLADDETIARRFHGEARSAAAIGRRGVVDILDYDVDPERGPFLVMEYLRGESLAAHFERRGQLPPGEASAIASSLLDTLGAVHERGIIHRDLKPDNVFLANGEGETVVKIVDFGISRVMDPHDRSAQLTSPGVVLGTPVYMAPEQARGDPSVDHRADLYAVGAILYESFAGRPPYTGQSWQQVYAHVLTSPPPPLETLRPDLPADLRAVIDTALARDPGDRYQSALSMKSALVGAQPPRELPQAPRSPTGGAPDGAMAMAPTVQSDERERPRAGPAAASPGPIEVARRSVSGSHTGETDASRQRWTWLVLSTLVLGLAAAASGVALFLWLDPPGEPRGTQPTPPDARSGSPTPEDAPAREPAPTDHETEVASAIERKLRRAEQARRAGRAGEARSLAEEAVNMAFEAQVTPGSAGARAAAEARMLLGDMAAGGIGPIGATETSEDFNAAWTRIADAYSAAARHYGRVATHGHGDLTKCATVRSARAAEKLASAASRAEAPARLARVDETTADELESRFRDSKEAYLRTARQLYESAIRLGGTASGCHVEARDGHARLSRRLNERTP